MTRRSNILEMSLGTDDAVAASFELGCQRNKPNAVDADFC
jgi:hypothetical protein